MKPKREDEIDETVRRFAAGDRSPEVLERLNSAAFECFHSPWETGQKAAEMDLPGIFQKPLPLEEEGEHSGRLPETEGLQIPPLIRRSRQAPELPVSPLPEAENVEAVLPLERLAEALSNLGRLPFLAPGLGVKVDLPFDRVADSRSFLAFQAATEEECIKVHSRGDLALSGLSEAELQRICRIFNRPESVLQASTYRRYEGARLRVHLLATIPFELTLSPQALEARLVEIFQQDRAFWRMVSRRRPL